MSRVIAFDPGRKNLAMCMITAETMGKTPRILKWAVVSIDPSPHGLLDGLSSVNFDEWVQSSQSTVVAVIERQPFKNPTMKRLEHYLEMACVTKGIGATTIDAKHKLTYAMSTPWWPSRPIATWSYGERKKLSVETVSCMLDDPTSDQSEDMAEIFRTSKKKDDLADAFLHAAAYLRLYGGVQETQKRPLRRIKPTAPSERNVKYGTYSQANLKYVAATSLTSFDAFEARADDVPGFASSCRTHFETLENAYVQLGGK